MGINGRYREHRSNYPECLILDCWSSKRSKDFEKFLHTKLWKYRYKQLPGHETENELFLVGGELSYTALLKLVEENRAQFDDDCLNNCDLGNKSLTKAIATNKPYKGYYYKLLDEKIVI